MMKQIWQLVLVVFVCGLAAGCAADDPFEVGFDVPTTTAPPTTTSPDQVDPNSIPEIPEDAVDLTGQADVTVIVTDNRFSERIIVVSPGTDVVWVNSGRNKHNVFAVDDTFEKIETEDLEPGLSAARQFDAVGEFAYYCSIHGTATRGQRGSVLVVPAA